jgi:hypothetical protein
MIFPINKSCYKIIEHVFNTNGTKISRLLKETSVSQKVGYKHIEVLEKVGVIKKENIGSLRIIKPNIENETGKLMFSLLEKEKELRLIEKRPSLKGSLINLKNGASKFNIYSILLFGSFLNGDKDRKIEVLIISNNNDKNIINFLQQCFNNVENAVSARILSREGFIKFRNTRKDFYQDMFKNYVCVYKPKNFVELISHAL